MISVPLGVMESRPMPKRLSGAVADEMSPTNEVPAHRSRPHVKTPGQSRASDAPAATSLHLDEILPPHELRAS